MTTTRYSISIPATISVVLEQDHEPTSDEVFEAVGKYPTLKHGESWDVDEFIIDWDEPVD